MARQLRSDLPDGIYHVTTRAVAGSFAYRDDDDRRTFLGLLSGVVDGCNWRAHAFCLMGTHYHLVVESTRTLLSRGMKRLNGLYAQGFNQRHGRAGHLWGDRFAARVIVDEDYLRAVCGYVILNPVRAGLLRRPARLALERLPLRRRRGSGGRHECATTRAGRPA